MQDNTNQMSPTKEQSFTKVLNINSKSYELNLHLEPQSSVMKFNIIDKTDPQKIQTFFNRFSLNQVEKSQTEQHLKKILNFQTIKAMPTVNHRFDCIKQMINKNQLQIIQEMDQSQQNKVIKLKVKLILFEFSEDVNSVFELDLRQKGFGQGTGEDLKMLKIELKELSVINAKIEYLQVQQKIIKEKLEGIIKNPNIINNNTQGFSTEQSILLQKMIEQKVDQTLVQRNYEIEQKVKQVLEILFEEKFNGLVTQQNEKAMQQENNNKQLIAESAKKIIQDTQVLTSNVNEQLILQLQSEIKVITNKTEEISKDLNLQIEKITQIIENHTKECDESKKKQEKKDLQEEQKMQSPQKKPDDQQLQKDESKIIEKRSIKEVIQIQHLEDLHEEQIMCTAYCDELRLLATGSRDKSIKILLFNEENKQFYEVQHLKDIHLRDVSQLEFSQNKKYLFSCSFDGTIKIFQILTENINYNNFIQNQSIIQQVQHIQDQFGDIQHNLDDCGTVLDIKISNSSKVLIACFSDSTLKLFDITKLPTKFPKTIQILELQNVHIIGFSSDNCILASAGYNHLFVYGVQEDFNNLMKITTLCLQENFHDDYIRKVEFINQEYLNSISILQQTEKQQESQKCYVICSCSEDMSFKISQILVDCVQQGQFKVFSNCKVQQLKQFSFFEQSVVLNFRISESQYIDDENRRYLLLTTSTRAGSIQIAPLCMKTFDLLQPIINLLNVYEDTIEGLSLFKNGQVLITGSEDKSVKLFEIIQKQQF